MATRLYIEATNTPFLSPAFDAGWASTGEAVRRKLSTTKTAPTETRAGSFGNSVNDNDLIVQAISDPLDGDQTILNTGTWSGTTDGRELLAEDNIDQKVRKLWVVKPDGTSRGTLVALAAAGNLTEATTSLAGMQLANGGGLTQVAALSGDRIVAELGYGSSVGGVTPNWEMRLGGNGTDHAVGQGDVTGTVGWIEFSQNLTFMAAIGDTSQLVWDVRAALGDTVQLIWNIRAALGDTSQFIWDVRTAIGDTIQALWDVRAAVGKDSTFFWNVSDLMPIGDQLQLLWNVLALDKWLEPPTISEGWPQPRGTPLIIQLMQIPRGISLIKEAGIWSQVRYVSSDRIAAAQKFYQGGRRYGPLTAEEEADLIAGGFGAYIIAE